MRGEEKAVEKQLNQTILGTQACCQNGLKSWLFGRLGCNKSEGILARWQRQAVTLSFERLGFRAQKKY